MVRVLGVVAVELVIAELQDQPPPQEGLHLRAAQLAVEPLSAEKSYVAQLNARVAQLLNDHLYRHLPEVLPRGLEVGAGGVVECDRDSGLWSNELAQRLVSDGVRDRVPHRPGDVRDRRQRGPGRQRPGPLGHLYTQTPVPTDDVLCPRVGHELCSSC